MATASNITVSSNPNPYVITTVKPIDWDDSMTISFGKGIKKKKHFSGYLDMCYPYNVYIKKVMYYDPATIVFWSDGTKTVSKCKEGDVYSEECGLMICVMKKIMGATKVHELMHDWISYEQNEVTLKDVREKHKDK